LRKSINYNYAFVFYDIADRESEAGKYRVAKVFKICKKYFSHHQKSVFKGETTPSKLLKFKAEIEGVIDKDLDFVTIIKLKSDSYFEEETIGNSEQSQESIFI